MTAALTSDKFGEFRRFLERRGYSFEPRPHQEFLAKSKQAVVNLYSSGKVVIGGSSPGEKATIAAFVAQLSDALPIAGAQTSTSELLDLDFHETRVGSDEAGKGDYFGPLVACAVLATEYQAQKLKEAGVRDSKELRGADVHKLASLIRDKILQAGQWKRVLVSPRRYNVLVAEFGNLNRMLAWAHARVIEDVLKFNEPCSLAIADQFGDPKFIEDALMAKGKTIRLVQSPKGERDVVVAAASVLARDEFVTAMEGMRNEFGERFPLGASHVEDFARRLVEKRGEEFLLDVAKVHFATTSRVVSEPSRLSFALQARKSVTDSSPR